jgi:hypothetical protein
MADATTPTTAQLLRAWERLNTVKNQLVKAGALSGDATPTQVLDALRKLVPADLVK